MKDDSFVSPADLEAGLEYLRQAPREAGTLRMIVRRPQVDEREVVDEGELDLALGLVGDGWLARGTEAEPAEPDMQLNIMNARAIELISPAVERRPLAGDQLYVDFDLSTANLPVGSRLAIGTAVVEITAVPHLGCKKFARRFGQDAVKFVNSATGKSLRLRGVNARVVLAGVIRTGDAVVKLPPT